jgi:hypothetical protein
VIRLISIVLAAQLAVAGGAFAQAPGEAESDNSGGPSAGVGGTGAGDNGPDIVLPVIVRKQSGKARLAPANDETARPRCPLGPDNGMPCESYSH